MEAKSLANQKGVLRLDKKHAETLLESHVWLCWLKSLLLAKLLRDNPNMVGCPNYSWVLGSGSGVYRLWGVLWGFKVDCPNHAPFSFLSLVECGPYGVSIRDHNVDNPPQYCFFEVTRFKVEGSGFLGYSGESHGQENGSGPA